MGIRGAFRVVRGRDPRIAVVPIHEIVDISVDRVGHRGQRETRGAVGRPGAI